jgi:hypothetical protein
MRQLDRRPRDAVVVRTTEIQRLDEEIRRHGGILVQDYEDFHVWFLEKHFIVLIDSEFQIPTTW